MIVRARWQLQGGHVHVRVFATMYGEHALGKAGDLTFRKEEWDVIAPALERGAGWQVLPESRGDAATTEGSAS